MSTPTYFWLDEHYQLDTSDFHAVGTWTFDDISKVIEPEVEPDGARGFRPPRVEEELVAL